MLVSRRERASEAMGCIRTICSAKLRRAFFQAEDGIRDYKVTGVQTCALPILAMSADERAGRTSLREKQIAEEPGRRDLLFAEARPPCPLVRAHRHAIESRRIDFGDRKSVV